jgi:hypothetical protein
MAVGVESTYMYYWMADACREKNIPFFLGHAYYMKTIHGAKTKNETTKKCNFIVLECYILLT